MPFTKKTKKQQILVRMRSRERNPYTALVGMHINVATVEISREAAYYPAISCPKESKAECSRDP
jgi:hypothetical protein